MIPQCYLITRHSIEQNIQQKQKMSWQEISWINQLVFQSIQQKQLYPGVCNLCYRDQQPHQTRYCEFSTILYHATERINLQSIIENGLHAHFGRLGNAIYCSDNPRMCLKYVQKQTKKFQDPILLKIKCMITNVLKVRNVMDKDKKKDKIHQYDCIKCPYFVYQNLFQWAVLNTTDYQIVGYVDFKELIKKYAFFKQNNVNIYSYFKSQVHQQVRAFRLKNKDIDKLDHTLKKQPYRMKHSKQLAKLSNQSKYQRSKRMSKLKIRQLQMANSLNQNIKEENKNLLNQFVKSINDKNKQKDNFQEINKIKMLDQSQLNPEKKDNLIKKKKNKKQI